MYFKHKFKVFELAYSDALKKIVGCPKFSSSHITAEICQQFLFQHGVCQVKYMHRILKHFNQIFTFYKTRLKAGVFLVM